MATEKPTFVERSLEECIRSFWLSGQHGKSCHFGKCRCGLDELYDYANKKLATLRASHRALVEALKGIKAFAARYPWTGLADAKSYGDPMQAVRKALAQAAMGLEKGA